jgi:hypothetical protein
VQTVFITKVVGRLDKEKTESIYNSREGRKSVGVELLWLEFGLQPAVEERGNRW